MTALNTIMDNGWDTEICAKPDFITQSTGNWRGYGRVFASQKITKIDQIIGVISRQYFDPNAHDAYNIIIATTTSEDDMDNIEKAIKKVCATYSPTSAENILQWEGGEIIPFNGVRWIFTMTILVRRAGMTAYT